MERIKYLDTTLQEEIRELRKKLRKIDNDDTQSIGKMTRIRKRITDLLQAILDEQLNIENFSYRTSVHDLLSDGFTKASVMRVTLHIIDKLISAGFHIHINYKDLSRKTCLDIAVKNCHYNAIELLVAHGAESAIESAPYRTCIMKKSPIVLLASQPNVKLELLDLLATPHNLNNCSRYRYLPLHEAATRGHIETALHLVRLGARVVQRDGLKYLPVEYYWKYNISHLNHDLFLSLLPPKSHGEAILRLICKILIGEHVCTKLAEEVNWALSVLLQRLHFDGPLTVKMHHKGYFGVNGERISTRKDGKSIPNARYLCSRILTELQFDFDSTPARIIDTLANSATRKQVFCVRATDEVWKIHRQQSRLRSLERLCILQVRSCMRSLDDESFGSLPASLPPRIRSEVLTYRDVSDTIFKDWRQGPVMS